MKFTKPPLTVDQQAELLISRGLVAEKADLVARLISVSYYRLCGYWYPFKRADDSFVPGTTLELVWRRYTFDRQFRLLVMDAIERVEITIRTRLAYELTHRFGAFAQLDNRSFPGIPAIEHQRLLDDLHENAIRSREAFVAHFRSVYDEFPDLPLWAAAETMTFGQMLTMYRHCGKYVQRDIAGLFRLSGTVLLSWLLTLNYTRNLCAHHSRLWNRVLAIKPMIPDVRHHPLWHAAPAVSNDRIFAVLTLLRYLLGRTAPQTKWRERLYALIDASPEIPVMEMGAPVNWRDHPLWS